MPLTICSPEPNSLNVLSRAKLLVIPVLEPLSLGSSLFLGGGLRACATAQHYVRAWLFLGEISSTSIMITPLLKSHEASLADIILSLQVFTRAKVSAGLQSVRLASTDA